MVTLEIMYFGGIPELTVSYGKIRKFAKECVEYANL